jgi:Ca2+-binding RTX toxin-like protein
MAVITSTSGTDWSAVSLNGAAFDTDAEEIGNRFELMFDAFISGPVTPISASTTQVVVTLPTLGGAQLTAIGTNLHLGSASISTFIFLNGAETMTLKGTFDLVGATDKITEASRTVDNETLTIKGNLTVTSDSGDYTGTVTSVTMLTSDGYAITLTGAGLTATRVDTTTTVGGTFNKIVVTGPGSATPLLQVTGIGFTGLPAGFDNLGDFLAAFTGGNDSVAGGTGNDSLAGYGGNDTLVGGAANDTLDGGAGNDSMDGGLGNDSYVGGEGNDIYVVAHAGDAVGLGVDSMDAGTDTVRLALATHALRDISGSAELENLVFTGTGAVALTGNAAGNSLVGGAGADTLDGGAGADTMVGGAGNDRFLVDDAGDVVTDTGGIDTVITSVAGVTLGGGLENLVLNANAIGVGNALANVLTAGDGNAVLLQGLAGNDTYNVTDDDEVFEDSIVGAGTADLVIVTLSGDADYTLGDNVEFGQLAGNDDGQQLTGNGQNNKLTGAAGDDILDGGAGNDTLIGNAGDDQFLASAGKDSLSGGAGNDFYYVDLVNLTAATLGVQDVVGAEALNAGTDMLLLVGGAGITLNTTALAVTLGANIEGLDFSATANPLLINATGNALDNWISANGASSKLDGGAGNDSIEGGGGNDTLLGAAGNDTLEGGEGNDSLDGGLGNDELQESFGDDVFVIAQAGDTIVEVEANSSVDTVRVGLAGSAFLDISAHTFLENVVYTGAGGAAITGNAGNNSLLGGTGADTILGGAGNDTLGVNLLTDSVSGGADTDTVLSTIAYSLVGKDDVENLTLGGAANKATGNGGDNILTGNAAANTLDGGLGNDTLIGGNGADVYVVDNADDQVVETMAGAAGGIDLVNTAADFSLAGSQIENATVTGATGRLLTGNDLANKLTGSGGDDTLSGGTLNDTLTGAAGNDSLDGGIGNDSMAGGLGNDSYVVDAALDKVTEVAGQGTDTVLSSITYSIAAATAVENITLTGGGTINATGNTGNNVLIGNTGANTIFGGAGNDSLEGGGANDTLDGGLGTDTAVYTGNQADYIITSLGNGVFTVTSIADGIDRLTGIERISFADSPDQPLEDVNALVAALDAGIGSHLIGSGTITINYSFMTAAADYGIPNDDHPGFQAPGVALENAITAALGAWEEVTNIDFVLATDNNVDNLFRFGTEFINGNDGLAGYAYLPQSGDEMANGELWTGDVWLNRNFFLYDDSEQAGFVAGTSVFSTLIHEIGHTLGLKHPFEGPDTLPPAQNNSLYTIMAYDAAPNSSLLQWVDVPGVDGWWYGFGGTVEARTPMVYDISTIQAIYGANTSTRDGDTTYGTNVTDGGTAFGIDEPFFLTIWDGGGMDTIDVSHLDLPNVIDLRPGSFSSIGKSNYLGLNDLGDVVNHGIFDPEGASPTEEGYDYLEETPQAPFGFLDAFSTDHPATWPDSQFDQGELYNGTSNLAIAGAAIIENAIGGSAADTLTGNAAANELSGGGGNDVLTGGAGADRFIFDTAPNSITNTDRITDFTAGSDEFVLDIDIFTALELGDLQAEAFTTGAFAAGDYIRYIVSSGELWYDPAGDGVGGVAEIKFAVLSNKPATLSASDFLVIA